MNIQPEPAHKKYNSDYGSLEIQNLKGDPSTIIPDKSEYLNFTNTRMSSSLLATSTLSASDGGPLLFTRTDAQQAVSMAIQHDRLHRSLANRMHRHDFFALSIIASGTIEIQIETQRRQYQAGDVVIVNRNTRHAEDILRNAALYDIELSKDYLIQWPEADELFTYMDETQRQFFSKNLSNESKRNRNFIEFRYLGDGSQIEILEIFQKITDELEQKRPGFPLMIRALTYRLFATLSDPEQYTCNYVDLGFDGGEALAITTKQYLDQTKRKISRTELSERLHYSSTHINRVFQKHFGSSVKDYNRKIFMQEAARLLTCTNRSVQDIIREIGFDNRTHFYKLFSETFQMTPGEYRSRSAASGK